MENKELLIKQQITIDLNYHFKQNNEGFQVESRFQRAHEEQLNYSLINLINLIKNRIGNLYGLAISNLDNPSRLSTDLPYPTLLFDQQQQDLHDLPSLSDYVQMPNIDPLFGPPTGQQQQGLHNLPSSNYVQMPNINPLFSPPPGQQQHQQHMRFSSMIARSFDQRPRRYQPYYHSHMHPPPHHHPLYLNDGRPPPPPPQQSINNTFVPTTTSNQQINIENLDPGAQSDELRAKFSYSQRQSLLNNPEFQSILDNLKRPP